MRPSIVVPQIIPNQLFRTLHDVETPTIAQTPSAPKRSFKREKYLLINYKNIVLFVQKYHYLVPQLQVIIVHLLPPALLVCL